MMDTPKDSANTERTISAPTKRRLAIAGVASIASVAFAVGCVIWSIDIQYREGLTHLTFGSKSVWKALFPFVIAALSPLLPLTLAVALVIGGGEGRNAGGRRLCVTILLVGAAVSIGVLYMSREPSSRPFLRGVRDWATRNVDTEVIRAWRDRIGDSTVVVDPNGLPGPVREWAPAEVCALPEGWTAIVWGGGFGHWGLLVGPPNQTAPHFVEGPRLRVKAGLHVWHEGS